jgi:type II secretory pathway component PulM
VLEIPARLGLPYRSISVISGVAVLAGSWLLIRRAPFPVWLRAVIPFTYFIFYQYGVVARSYCLLAPLLWLAAMAHPSRRVRPWRWIVPLVLLTEVSVHGLILAVCWEGLRGHELAREWRVLGRRERRRQLWPTVVLMMFVALAVVELWPNNDISGGGSVHLALNLRSLLFPSFPLALVEWTGIVALLISLLWMHQRQLLRYFAVPATALLLFFVFRYFSPWHGGVLFELWVASLWIAWRQPARHGIRGARALLAFRAPLAIGVVVLGQVVLTAEAAASDFWLPYSGAAALAAYIRDHNLDHRVDAEGKWVVAVLPYFSDMPFADYNGGKLPAYYPWSRNNNPLPSNSAVLARSPEVIVFAVESRSTQAVYCLPGYSVATVFPGDVIVVGVRYESETYVVFKRDPSSTKTAHDVCLHVSP